MLILALDLATTTGWAYGNSGQRPRYGKWRLRPPSAPPEEGAAQLGKHLRDFLDKETFCPELIVYEAPLNPQAQFATDENGGGRRMNFHSTSQPWMLVGSVVTTAGFYDVRTIASRANTVRKVFCGRGNFGSREASKKAVLDQCHRMGFMHPHEKNNDMADAISIWYWAQIVHGKWDPPFELQFG
jgi:hypothetical protein